MQSKFTFLKDIGIKETIPLLKMQFWYFEYIKRHLLIYEHSLCNNIYVAIGNILGELIEKNQLSKKNESIHKGDILKELIAEHFFYKYKIKIPLQYAKNERSLLLSIKNSLGYLDFLCEISLRYEHYAHELIRPHDMAEVLNLVNSGEDVASFATEPFFLLLRHENWITKINYDSTELNDATEVSISFDITSADFDLDKIIDEIKYRVAHRRHLLKREGAKINFSDNEMEIIARKNAPQKMNQISLTYDASRAVGLYCWDTITGIADKKYIPYKTDISLTESNQFPSFLTPFTERKTTDREFLFSMVEKGLLKEFHSGGTCQQKKESCIYNTDGKKDMGPNIRNRKCNHYDHCLRKLNNLIRNADLSVQKMQIIPIAKERLR